MILRFDSEVIYSEVLDVISNPPPAIKIRSEEIFKKRPDFDTSEARSDKEAMAAPHPVRLVGYAETISRFEYLTDGWYPDIACLLSSHLSITEIEYCLSIMLDSGALFDPSRRSIFGETLAKHGVGIFYTMAVPLAYHFRNGSLVEFDKSAIKESIHLDVGNKLTCNYIQLPNPCTYISLAELRDDDQSDYFVEDSSTGLHKLEGCYVFERKNSPIDLAATDRKILNLSSEFERSGRVIDLVFIGAPKANVGDDATLRIQLLVDDSMTIQDMLARHLKLYESDKTLKPEDENAIKLNNFTCGDFAVNTNNSIKNIALIVNMLAYLSCAEFRRQETNEHTALRKKIESMGEKRRAKMSKHLAKKTDLILISSLSPIFNGSTLRGENRLLESGYKVMPHIRRPFMRMQPYGSRSEPKYKAVFMKAQNVAQGIKGDTSVESEPIPSKNYSVKGTS